MQGGIKGELNIGALIGKRLSVIGTALRGRPVDGPHGKGPIVDAVLDSVWPMVERGSVRPVIGARLPITSAGEAHRLLESGEVIASGWDDRVVRTRVDQAWLPEEFRRQLSTSTLTRTDGLRTLFGVQA